MNSPTAKAISDAIIYDLRGRAGIKHSWDSIDEEIQGEIRDHWATIASDLIAQQDTKVLDLLRDVERCLRPISQTGRLSEGGEQRGNHLDVDDCHRKIGAFLLGVNRAG